MKKRSFGGCFCVGIFSTKVFDEETGLYYYGYRYYSPELGRWISRDPVEELGFKYHKRRLSPRENNHNLYHFTNNDPINEKDYNGLAVLAKCWYTSGGGLFGVGFLECNVEASCYKGIREKGKYVGWLKGVTWGAPLGTSYFTLYDEKIFLLEQLNGDVHLNTLSMAFIFGSSAGEICIGQLCSVFNISGQFGLDYSVDLFNGSGKVRDIERSCCNYK